MTFKRTYRRLTFGAKTAVALSAGKSLEWISRLIRTGGDACPAEKYVRWISDLRTGDTAIADEIHELVNEEVRELRRDEAGAFNPNQTVTTFAAHLANVARHLLDGSLTPDDESAVLQLVAAGETALAQIRAAQNKPQPVGKPITLIGGQPNVREPRRARR